MMWYPPRPTTILQQGINPEEWLIQPKYRGWRIVISNNKCFTRKGNLIDIDVSYPKLDFNYQLDGEIISTEFQTEHKVRRAIKNGTWKIKIFDIFIPDKPNLILIDRLKILDALFNIKVEIIPFNNADEIFSILKRMQDLGYEGIVIKRKDGIYKTSQLGEIVDNNWIKLK